MPTLLPWTTVELGDTDIFSPTLPSLVVYTWYVDDEPESSITHFWMDDGSGEVRSELLFIGPVEFEAAVSQAKERAPERKVERIHVRHARGSRAKAGPTKAAAPAASKPKTAAKAARRAKPADKASPSAKKPATGARRKS